MNVVPFEYLVAREVRSRRLEVFSLCCWDSYRTHDAGGRFFVDFELRAGAQKVGSRAIVGIRGLCSKSRWCRAREPLGHAEGHYVVVQIV